MKRFIHKEKEKAEAARQQRMEKTFDKTVKKEKEAFDKTVKEAISHAMEKFQFAHTAIFEQIDFPFKEGSSDSQQMDTGPSMQEKEELKSCSKIPVFEASSKAQIGSSFEKGSSDSELQQNQMNTGPSMQEKVEVTQDPRNEALPIRNELARLISQRRYEEAFVISLQRTDRSVLSWLCSEFLLGILSMNPLPLSQRVLLSLVQRLTLDLNQDISQKLNWITYLAAVIDPKDSTIAFDGKPIFEQLRQRLHYQFHSPLLGGTQFLSIRPPLSGTQLLSVLLLLRVIESLAEPM